jgi:hypothetical protein
MDLSDTALVKEVANGFNLLKPFYEFLWKVRIEGEAI